MSGSLVTAESLLFGDPNIAWYRALNCCKRGRLGLLVFYFSPFYVATSSGRQGTRKVILLTLYARGWYALLKTETCHNSNLSAVPTHIRYIPTQAHARSLTARSSPYHLRHPSLTPATPTSIGQHPPPATTTSPPPPPSLWASATSPRYASAHLSRCVLWSALRRLSQARISPSRNATRGLLSWQTQSSSRALPGLRTSSH
jgi:hypothetical protein